MKPEWRWPLFIVALLTIPIAANGYLWYRSASDPTFAVEPDYYKKALAWDQHRADEARSAALGWHVTVAEGPELRLHIADKDGLPVDGAEVTVEALHIARAGLVTRAHLGPAPEHAYASSLRLAPPGLWELRVHVTRGQDRFEAVLRKDVRP